MMQRTHQTHNVNGDAQTKWFNSPVAFHEGNLADIRKYIPTFERRCFALTQTDYKMSRLNENLDTIVRLPFGDDQNYIPVGVVSKHYILVQHLEIIDVVTKALENMKIVPNDVKAEIKITEYGERIALSIYLPDRYQIDPGDGNLMALRMEFLNSVDGSTRFRALMGWFRFVCSNGLIIGVTHSDVYRRHVGELQLSNVSALLTSGMKESENEKKNFECWRETKITKAQLIKWVNNDLRKGWGFKAAARTYHIACRGYDVAVVGQYKDSTPTTINIRRTKRVPGTPEQCHNLFDLSQILAWLAKERRDIQEQVIWRDMISGLLKPLLH